MSTRILFENSNLTTWSAKIFRSRCPPVFPKYSRAQQELRVGRPRRPVAGSNGEVTMKTVGEQRVRVDFNPSADGVVDQIKQKTAELINIVETLKGKDARLASLAQTSFEEAAMWAVKAATA